ncbi:MAG: hypothetical protein J6T72_01100 [Alphaproteobacteria bacterium]|nr:hypothetical protein [Alphaproteobacteria bacterium]
MKKKKLKKNKKKAKRQKKLKKVLKNMGECLLIFVAGFGYVAVVLVFVWLLRKLGANYPDSQLVMIALALTILLPIIIGLLILAGFRLWLAFAEWRRNK